MKIIDKNKGKTRKKDYYDYLTGIYGIDEKLVLDRRSGINIQFPPNYLRFYIAGYIVEGLCIDDKFYYGEDLDKFKIDAKKSKYWLSKHWDRDYSKSIAVKYTGIITNENWIYTEPMVDKDNINHRFDCPILIDLHPAWRELEVNEYPMLSKFDLAKFIPAETIYQWLTAWLGNQITLRGKSPELSNDGKIEAKGMDKKTSFRPKMK